MDGPGMKLLVMESRKRTQPGDYPFLIMKSQDNSDPDFGLIIKKFYWETRLYQLLTSSKGQKMKIMAAAL
jgi:hypothetical protein